MLRAVCLITRDPNTIWMQFLDQFKTYDVYVVVDNNNWKPECFNILYPNIHFYQIDDDLCKQTGFYNSSVAMDLKPVISWDKALYFFANICTKYEQIWFLEDDVFIFEEKTLNILDNTHKTADVILKRYTKYKTPKHLLTKFWHWDKITIQFNSPLFQSMICVCRLSKLFLKHLNEYVKINKSLCFIEALIPTIALKKKLNVKCPSNFDTIRWKSNYEKEQINKQNLFHPVKDINKHKEFRQQ